MASVREMYKTFREEDQGAGNIFKNMALRDSFDTGLVEALVSKDFSAETIADVVAKKSPSIFARAHAASMEDVKTYILALLPQEMQNNPENGRNHEHRIGEISADGVFEKYQNRWLKDRASELSNAYFSYDAGIASRLLDGNFSLSEVSQGVEKYSHFSSLIPDYELRQAYAFKVMEYVDVMRNGLLQHNMAPAEEAYARKMQEQAASWPADMKEREGNAVLAMLMDGFSPEIAEKVLLRHNEDKDYVTVTIMNCVDVYRFYQKLQTPLRFSEAQSNEDVYRFFAGAYMRPRHVSVLRRADDLIIASRMFAKGLSEEKIRDALPYSPVARMMIRNKPYLANLFEKARAVRNRIEKEQKEMSRYEAVPREHPMQAAAEEYVYHLRAAQARFSIPTDFAVDVSIAKAMLAEGFTAGEVRNALQSSPCADSASYGEKVLEHEKHRAGSQCKPTVERGR